jgi:hypothetical protein
MNVRTDDAKPTATEGEASGVSGHCDDLVARIIAIVTSFS